MQIIATARTLVLWNGRMLTSSSGSLEPVALERRLLPAGTDIVPLGGEAAPAAALLGPLDECAAAAFAATVAPAATFTDPMRELGRFAPALRQAVVRGIALERWSHRHRWCGIDGSPLAWTAGGTAKVCTVGERPHRHFPRLDPAVIVLVHDGERALLGRARRFPPGFYSTIAGFVEPGETIEDTVRREVREETGIGVGAVRYFGSEPWPFPASLMLGFHADATSTQIALHDAELEDARWFAHAELVALQAMMKAERPYFESMARRLIDRWLRDPRTA